LRLRGRCGSATGEDVGVYGLGFRYRGLRTVGDGTRRRCGCRCGCRLTSEPAKQQETHNTSRTLPQDPNRKHELYSTASSTSRCTVTANSPRDDVNAFQSHLTSHHLAFPQPPTHARTPFLFPFLRRPERPPMPCACRGCRGCRASAVRRGGRWDGGRAGCLVAGLLDGRTR
jgi:hypothetical protein